MSQASAIWHSDSRRAGSPRIHMALLASCADVSQEIAEHIEHERAFVSIARRNQGAYRKESPSAFVHW
jgi:hypothetical protein